MTSRIMHNRILYILAILALPLCSLAQEPADLFTRGNQQYAKADYKHAAESYQQIVNTGYHSAAVYFNLGNAWYKLGALPSALLYYEKAHKLAPGDEDINFNLQLASSKTTDKLEAVPDFFLSNWWRSFILGFSVSTLSLLSILLYLAGFGILILYLFANSVFIKKTAFYTGIVLIATGMICILVAGLQTHYFNAHQEAIVFNNSVTVKSEPLATSKALFVLHEGTKVNIRAREQGWIKIELSNGNIGWMEIAAVKEI